MNSKLKVVDDRKNEWEERKLRVGGKLGEIVAFTRQTLKELIPDIEAIKDKRLWEHGDYESFKDFCNRALNVTSRRIYQLLSEKDARKVLEFNDGEGNNFTPDEPESVDKKDETFIEPPAEKQKRKGRAQPEPVDAESAEPPPDPVFPDEPSDMTVNGIPVAQLAESAPTTSSITDELLPPAAIVTTSDTSVRVCPHCGKGIE